MPLATRTRHATATPRADDRLLAGVAATKRVACPTYSTCIDAADTDGNLIIAAPGDSGLCEPTASPIGESMMIVSNAHPLHTCFVMIFPLRVHCSGRPER